MEKSEIEAKIENGLTAALYTQYHELIIFNRLFLSRGVVPSSRSLIANAVDIVIIN